MHTFSVLASDGLFYGDPVLCGYKWSLVFEEKAVARLCVYGRRLRVKAAVTVLKENKIDGYVFGTPTRSGERTCFSVELRGPPPAHLIQSGEGSRQPLHGTAVLDFGLPWG